MSRAPSRNPILLHPAKNGGEGEASSPSQPGGANIFDGGADGDAHAAGHCRIGSATSIFYCQKGSMRAAVGSLRNGMDAEWLRKQFERTNLTQVGLARKLGIHETIVNKMVKKRRRIKADEMPAIREFFGLPAEDGNHEGVRPRNQSGYGSVPKYTPVVVYRSSAWGGGRSGGVLVHKNEKRGEIDRIEGLRYSDKAYAFELSEDFGDAFQVRDTLVLDPDSSPAAGDDCFFARSEESPLQQGILRRLIRKTDADWIVRAYGEERETKLSRSEYPIAWRIRQRIMRS